MNASTIASTQFSSHQFDTWRDSIDVVFDVERSAQEKGTPFHAKVDAFQLGHMVITDATLDAQRYIRPAARVRRDGIDHLVFNLYRKCGWKAQTSRGDFQGGPGEVSVLDLSCELLSDEPDCHLVALFMPRSLLEDRLPNIGALHGSAPAGPFAVLLAEYIDMLARRLPTLPSADGTALADATCRVLTACLAPSLDNVEAARPGLELVLLRRAKRFIESQLNRSSLNIDAICSALGASRRTIYRLFEQEGGVVHYIQSRRLERIRAMLFDTTETRRISDIAAEFGFMRADHFARLFKSRFGETARDIREQANPHLHQQSDDGRSVQGQHQGFDDWIRQLPS
jgi:AraC-like DNA-binding protein